MPNYEFVCKTCEQTVSFSQPITQALKIPVCAKCGFVMTQNFGLTGVSFKGSGFYSNDKRN